MFPLLITLTLFLQTVAPSNSFHAIFRSEDRGQTWSRSDTCISAGSRINAFAAFGNTIFAGTDSGLFVSSDAGRTWTNSNRENPMSVGVSSFAQTPDHLFAGTHRSGVLVTTNAGKNWIPIPNLPSEAIRSLAALNRTLYVGTEADGVFATADLGHTWQHLQAGLSPHSQIFTLSTVKNTLFAGLYSNGLYQWGPEKKNWIRRAAVTPLVLVSSRDILVAGHNPGGIFWSDDLGHTWTRSATTVSSLSEIKNDFSPLALPTPSELPTEAPVWAMAANDQLLLAGASDGIFISANHGRTWTRARTGLPATTPGIAFLIHRDLILAATILPPP